MNYCGDCDKSFEGDLQACPECGALLVQNEDCCTECSDCSSCGHTEFESDHEEHESCDGSCDVGLWPVGDDGNPVKPALLISVMGNQMDYEMTISLLQSLGVPTLRDYPNAIQNAKILLGFSGAGMDVYVPENMLELAKELLDSEPELIEE